MIIRTVIAVVVATGAFIGYKAFTTSDINTAQVASTVQNDKNKATTNVLSAITANNGNANRIAMDHGSATNSIHQNMQNAQDEVVEQTEEAVSHAEETADEMMDNAEEYTPTREDIEADPEA